MSKKTKLELNVSEEIKAWLVSDTAGMDVTNWTTHVSASCRTIWPRILPIEEALKRRCRFARPAVGVILRDFVEDGMGEVLRADSPVLSRPSSTNLLRNIRPPTTSAGVRERAPTIVHLHLFPPPDVFTASRFATAKLRSILLSSPRRFAPDDKRIARLSSQQRPVPAPALATPTGRNLRSPPGDSRLKPCA